MEIYRETNSSARPGLLKLGLEGFRSPRTMCVDGWKYADVTPGQSRRILIPYKRHSAASIFLLLSRSAPPFRRRTAKRAHYFFILKMNAEERESYLARERATERRARETLS